MLAPGDLTRAFELYWGEMGTCRSAGTHWALLHVTVCIPDICSALESDDGEATRARYKAWCEQYLPNPHLAPAERYRMRCKILHQGRAGLDEEGGRYRAFAFSRRSADGHVDHLRVEGDKLVLDVGELSNETEAGAKAWISDIESDLTGPRAALVERHFPSLVTVTAVLIPRKGPGGFPTTVSRTS
jgi:hypothetical protein